ncbi:MAG: arsenate reductase family protein [Parachlamydiaceae bacterium]|nr:arsenate reductase family protein [Parachlamydiaceae bacterium]
MTVYLYSNCSTCKEALTFLKQNNISFIQKEITVKPPSVDVLKRMLQFQNGNLKKLFNVSGQLYREMQLAEKLPNLTEEDALTLLSTHGMLVKRPFLIGKDFGLLGFKEEEWKKV